MLSLPRTVAALAVLTAGACTALMNWRFSYALGGNAVDSTTWATFAVALDVAKWLMLPFAARAWPAHKLRAAAAIAIWVIATLYSFTAAVGFAALHRDRAAAEHAAEADRRQVLQLMRRSPRWQASAACADATTAASREFCARYHAAERSLKAEATGDSQAALIARLTGLAPETASVGLCLFLALACEVISALGFLAILPPPAAPAAPAKTKAPPWQPPKWAPVITPPRPMATAATASKPAKQKSPR